MSADGKTEKHFPLIPATGFLQAIVTTVKPTGGWSVTDEEDHPGDCDCPGCEAEALENDDDGDDDDEPADGESFDGGFGPGSYFNHAMRKND